MSTKETENVASIEQATRWAAQEAHKPDVMRNARLELRYKRFREDSRHERVLEGVRVQEYTCDLTRRNFWLPYGAPVPTLVCHHYTYEGELQAPQDDPDFYYEVLPSLAAKGPEGVKEGIKNRIEDLRHCAADCLAQAREWETLLEDLEEHPLGLEWPRYWLESETVFSEEEAEEGKLHNVWEGQFTEIGLP